MTTELATLEDIRHVYGAGFFDRFRKAADLIASIKDWRDVENKLLRGAGLAPATYRTMMTALRGYLDHAGRANPFELGLGDVEHYYDSLTCSLSTRRNRIAALRRFYGNLEKMVPGWVSPFADADPKLTEKLNRTDTKGQRTALTAGELQALLAWLGKRSDARGVQDRAIVLFLATSGLRAAELCSLTWKALESVDGAWYAVGVGKGSKPFRQPLLDLAVDTARAAFRKVMRREPTPDDALFWTIPAVKGQVRRPIEPHVLWTRVRALGRAAAKAGVVNRASIIWSPHLMRRTYASVLNKSGMDLRAIQHLTRHASIDTLVNHYVDSRESPAPYFATVLEGVA